MLVRVDLLESQNSTLALLYGQTQNEVYTQQHTTELVRAENTKLKAALAGKDIGWIIWYDDNIVCCVVCGACTKIIMNSELEQCIGDTCRALQCAAAMCIPQPQPPATVPLPMPNSVTLTVPVVRQSSGSKLLHASTDQEARGLYGKWYQPELHHFWRYGVYFP